MADFLDRTSAGCESHACHRRKINGEAGIRTVAPSGRSIGGEPLFSPDDPHSPMARGRVLKGTVSPSDFPLGSNPIRFGHEKFNGEAGIRTQEPPCGRLRDFQSRSFGRSDTSPHCKRFMPIKSTQRRVRCFRSRHLYRWGSALPSHPALVWLRTINGEGGIRTAAPSGRSMRGKPRFPSHPVACGDRSSFLAEGSTF